MNLRLQKFSRHARSAADEGASRAVPEWRSKIFAGARATQKQNDGRQQRIYCVAGVAHTRRIFRFRDSSRARLISLMRLMSLLESCSLEANSQRTRHFSGSCLSFIGLPLLKWQDQVRHCETSHVSYLVEGGTAVLELVVHQ